MRPKRTWTQRHGKDREAVARLTRYGEEKQRWLERNPNASEQEKRRAFDAIIKRLTP